MSILDEFKGLFRVFFDVNGRSGWRRLVCRAASVMFLKHDMCSDVTVSVQHLQCNVGDWFCLSFLVFIRPVISFLPSGFFLALDFVRRICWEGRNPAVKLISVRFLILKRE